MTTSALQRERRNAVAAWLCDRFGTDDVPDAAFWKDADDMIRFLRANGLRIQPED